MKTYVTIEKTIQAIQYKKDNVQELFTDIGNYLFALPGTNIPASEIFKIQGLLANAKTNSFICLIDGELVNIPRLIFQADYELVP